ncbi:MAG: hypothetical protein AB7F86_15285 [Bdellovibrionales bacterium]
MERKVMYKDRIQQIKKSAIRSWSAEFRGRKDLGLQDKNLTEETLPFWVLAKQIAHKKNLVCEFAKDEYRRKIVEMQLEETELSFIFRYRWQYSNSSPFTAPWIFRFYRKLISERNLGDLFRN